MIYRIYFNRAGALPWSLDTGVGTHEHNAREIQCEDISMCSMYDPKADNTTAPRGWFMVSGEAVWDGESVRIKKL